MKTLESSRYGENRCASETLESAGAGSPIIIPGRVQMLTITLIVDSGEGKVQYTTSPASAVNEGDAVWRDWPAGSVSQTTEDALLAPVTAVRQVNVSGKTILEVVGA